MEYAKDLPGQERNVSFTASMCSMNATEEWERWSYLNGTNDSQHSMLTSKSFEVTGCMYGRRRVLFSWSGGRWKKLYRRCAGHRRRRNVFKWSHSPTAAWTKAPRSRNGDLYGKQRWITAIDRRWSFRADWRRDLETNTWNRRRKNGNWNGVEASDEGFGTESGSSGCGTQTRIPTSRRIMNLFGIYGRDKDSIEIKKIRTKKI